MREGAGAWLAGQSDRGRMNGRMDEWADEWTRG